MNKKLWAPVLYLDFDGVLHPDGTPALDEGLQLLNSPELFQWLPLLSGLLENFPSVLIIVSSDWARLFDDANLVRLLGPLGPRFVGVVESTGSTRAQAVLRDAARRGLGSCWLSLDDSPSVADQEKTDLHFVGCPPATGVADPRVQVRLTRRLAHLVSKGSC
jgi:hypothetical protein